MALEDIIKFDKYFWIARFFPALIVLVPFFIFQYFYLNNLIFEQLSILESYSALFHSIVMIIIIYISSILVRGFGKDLIEKFYFIRNNKFPTTVMLLGKKKEVSNQQLTNIKSKIKNEFKLDINNKSSQKEKISRIKDAVEQIITKVGYTNKILNQYNTEYGFFRNLTGGTIIFILTDILLISFSIVYKDSNILIISLSLLVGCLIYLVLSWHILDSYGTKYAKKLFNEYLQK